MRWIKLGERIKNLRWRSEYSGWLAASLLLFCTSIPLFIFTTSAAGVGLLPMYIAVIFFGMSFVSLYSLSYFTVRTIGPAKPIPEVLDSRLLMISGIIGAAFLLVLIVANISHHLLGVSLDALAPVSYLILILLSTLAIITGYDAAQLKNTKDQVEPVVGLNEDSPFLYDIVKGKSEWKAALAGILSISLVASITIYTGSIVDGVAMSGSIIAIILFVLRFYPEEE